ncbi:MAG: glycosyltransferase family 39 protein [Spirochaetaceae bacterium]|nr:glycosyltransferase family 39 protein [Spirochaetaceae bacterium]
MTLAGFTLRLNGFVRHSAWTDELESAVYYSSPNNPVSSVLDDTGNPPFYYFLLRCWFSVLGWSEETGTLLSVILGTGAIVTIYLFIAPFMGKRTALYAALFTAFSGFVIDYSHEMRAYIFKICMAPLASLCLLRIMQSFSLKYALLYIALSISIAGSHYYGILFVMANFLFFICNMICQRQWNGKRFFGFLAVNAVIAASFLPVFWYLVFQKGYNFKRNLAPGAGHIFLLAVVIAALSCFFLFKDKLQKLNFLICNNRTESLRFAPYCILLPAFMFCCAFLISLVKPLISIRRFWPICAPYFFALAAVFISRIADKYRFLKILFAYMVIAGLHRLTPDLPAGGTEGYREARAYIAADAAAHPERKAALLTDTSPIAAYYGYEELPVYRKGEQYDVLYVLHGVYSMNETDMYETLHIHKMDADNMLKIRFDYDFPRGDGNVIFKKFF